MSHCSPPSPKCKVNAAECEPIHEAKDRAKQLGSQPCRERWLYSVHPPRETRGTEDRLDGGGGERSNNIILSQLMRYRGDDRGGRGVGNEVTRGGEDERRAAAGQEEDVSQGWMMPQCYDSRTAGCGQLPPPPSRARQRQQHVVGRTGSRDRRSVSARRTDSLWQRDRETLHACGAACCVVCGRSECQAGCECPQAFRAKWCHDKVPQRCSLRCGAIIFSSKKSTLSLLLLSWACTMSGDCGQTG